MEAAVVERSSKLKARRVARVAGVTAVLGVVLGLSIAGGDARPPPAPAAGARAPKATLPQGCERARVTGLKPQRFRSPRDVVAPGSDVKAVIDTSCGKIELDLFEDRAPINVNSFAFLAGRGFYDGLPFHRIEKDSVVQSGDPNGRALDPPEGPGYSLPDELDGTDREQYVYGVVGMANRGPDTAGSQFFIVVHDIEGARKGNPEEAGYRPRYTIIGRVARSSWDTLERIAKVDVKGGLDPVRSVEPVLPVVIRSIDVEGGGQPQG